ncbi:MAG TPA: T9SS type A sorting domain-containing protein, partial [Ferruginibacter sp.]|nr:T9SS type A sorting domain-containing protein [Ferruginibacter sp.]
AGLSNVNIANPVANPAATTTYTITVTDSKGCTRTQSITVNVLPLSSAVCSGSGNNVKFAVCHMPPGNPSNPQNICIAANALSAHLTTGSNGHNNCYLGPCDQLCFSTTAGSSSFTVIGNGQNSSAPETPNTLDRSFNAVAYPNPSSGDFNVLISSGGIEPVSIRIIDITGQVVKVKITMIKGSMFKVGDELKIGTYFAEVSDGIHKQIIKLIKIR